MQWTWDKYAMVGLNHEGADLDPPQNSGQKCPKWWTNTHANKQANGPKVKAQKGALYFHQHDHSWHELDKPKQKLSKQK